MRHRRLGRHAAARKSRGPIVSDGQLSHAVVESSHEGIFAFDLTLRLIAWNQTMERTTGLRRSEVLGRPILTVFPFMLESGEHQILVATLRGESGVAPPQPNRMPDTGLEGFYQARYGPLRDATGAIIGGMAVVHDITARTRAESALRASEEKLRAIFEATEEWIWEIDQSGRHTFTNRAVERILGYDRAEILGSEATDWLHPDDSAAVAPLLRDSVIRREGWHGLVTRWRHRDGTYRSLESNASPIIDGNGQVIGFRGADRDVTERIASEAALREAEVRFRTLVEQLPAVVYTVPYGADAETSPTYHSPFVETVYGYSRDSWQSDSNFWISILYPEDRERVLAEVVRTDHTCEPFDLEYRQITADGRVIWVRDQAVLIRDENGTPAYWQGVVFDVTEEKSALTAVEASEARFRALVQHSSDITVVIAPDGNRTYVSPSAEVVLDFKPEELIGGRAFMTVHPDDLSRAAELMAALQAEPNVPHRGEWRVRHRDGSWRWFEVVGTNLIAEPAVGGIVFNARDVTERKAAEAAREASEEHLRLALASTRMDAWVWHAPTGWIESRNMDTLFGLPPGSFDGHHETFLACVHPEDRPRVEASDFQTLEQGVDFELDYRVVWPDGTVRWLAERGRVVERDATGRATRVIGTTLDVTERKQAEEALRANEVQFRQLFAASPHPTWVYDRDTLTFLEVNGAAVAHYGYSRDDFLAMTVADLHPRTGLLRALGDAAGELPSLADEAEARRHLTRDGHILDVELTAHDLTFHGRPAVLLVAQDVTERLALERELERQAFHDPLTGLPNRLLFLDRLDHALARVARSGDQVAVLFLDLDDFKVINDTLGHAAGDRLLVTVADRLGACLREGDTLARLGGDEFTLLLEDLPNSTEATRVAARIAEALRAPIDLDGREVFVTVSIGIAAPLPGTRADEVLRLADVAMYEAKERGKARFAVFDQGMDDRAWQRLRLEGELRRAIAEDQLRLHFQPVVSLESGRTVAVEALVRWEHPERGLVPPGEFIPLAEETGLIVPLGEWVLCAACNQIATWQRLHPDALPLGVSVNLSARQLLHPELVAEVTLCLAESGLDPARLTLEITETAALADATRTFATIRELKTLGVRLAIDDFGTGYAGLSYLRECPVDALKIDRSFVAGLARSVADAALVQAVAAFAGALGLEVTAEGIETAEQRAALHALGCSQGQGYLFARPLPPADLVAYLLSEDHGAPSANDGQRAIHLDQLAPAALLPSRLAVSVSNTPVSTAAEITIASGIPLSPTGS